MVASDLGGRCDRPIVDIDPEDVGNDLVPGLIGSWRLEYPEMF